ncbi:D-alanyl-D-alanine carboxypeptidase/D-alanyl-D-alanine endopeptidase [Mobilicoccus massiliensis]|uniref:D-alanyl-D-alanine carboxypeptidase/D-alanyl-D-alanine endopeptidase n=1 Tax=Mobilicoccus massiliensis TaxID=1522310 RepID=UPI0006932978|nr:D-alanyl-D-alanine carboxypeptidase/D-alanyl-D-alanine-endopeptidase [Mobilicoccus massiliensis]
MRAPPLSALASAAPAPTSSALKMRLAPLLKDPALGPSIGLVVRDGATGRTLLDHDGARPRTPASTAKLLTAAAITRVADGRHTFETKVVTGATPNDVVLVAGGDTLLAPGRGDRSAVAGRAGIADLAGQVATSLQRTGVRSVRVHLDDSYARGPALAPEWEPGDVSLGLTGPVTMLGTTDARALPGRAAPADPALRATSLLATELGRAGIEVRGRPDRAPAPAGAAPLGAVRSAPLTEVLALALDESDNALTESLARSTAAAQGVEPTFPAVATWVRTGLADLGVPVSGAELVDTSGLSRSTRAPANVVADVLTLASTGQDPALAEVVARLPVAGLSGTLFDRFHGPGARPAAGLARAKTGTLTGVHALGGTVVDADGRLLVYAVLVDRAGGTLEARAALDRLIAAIAACGCR